MNFSDPIAALALWLIPALIFYHLKKFRADAIRFSEPRRFASPEAPFFARGALVAPYLFRLAALTLLIVALAGPRSGYQDREIVSSGIDIMIALDVSSSMSTEDIEPTRLDAAKEVISRFVDRRRSDRIGLTLFSAHGYTQSPLTRDHKVFKTLLERASIGMIEDGTAVGDAIALASKRLISARDGDGAKTKIVILVTDGVSNRGLIDPVGAARLAAAARVKIYTIGVGRAGLFIQTVPNRRGSLSKTRVRTEIDETTLKEIARITGAHFFRATDSTALARIYDQIDQLEKSEIKFKVHDRWIERYRYFLGAALIFIALTMAHPIAPWGRWP